MSNTKHLRPPSRLPIAYRRIWQALADADRRASSRQALARHLGVSTATLQRILVDGDVPAFARTKNRRVMHAWARTLGRLALRLGQDPAVWVRDAGIRWDPAIAQIVEAARAGGGGGPVSARAAVRPESGVRGIAVVLQGPLASPLDDGRLSFLEELARRLAATLDPAGTVAIDRIRESEAPPLLARLDGIDLAVGVWDTARRRAQGLTILPIPGWEIPLRAVAIVSAEEDAAALAWEALIAPDPPLGCTRVAVEDSPAHLFLRGACGIEDGAIGAIVPARGADPASIASSLREGLDRSRPAVFIGDAFTCYDVVAALRASELPKGWRVLQIEQLEETAPRFGIGIALAAGERPGWEAAVLTALSRDLFAAGSLAMGRLYADAVLQQIAWARSLPPRAGTVLVPRAFAEAGEAFVEAYVARLLERLVPEDAALFVCAAWRWALRTISPRIPTSGAGARTTPYCRSCSASLRDPHNQGISDRFCRYCADESGRLKPREEVRRLLADWMLGWQGGLTEEEASRRADRLMQTMPAWSAN